MTSKLWQSGDGGSSERLKKLTLELCELVHKQMTALEDATFLGMTDEQTRAFDRRSQRISEITAMIEKFKSCLRF